MELLLLFLLSFTLTGTNNIFFYPDSADPDKCHFKMVMKAGTECNSGQSLASFEYALAYNPYDINDGEYSLYCKVSCTGDNTLDLMSLNCTI